MSQTATEDRPLLRECYYGVVASARINEASIPAEVTLVEGADSVLRLLEAKAPSGTLGVFEFVAGKADIINRNYRVYSQTVYELATARAQPLINEGRFLGEVDHPWRGTLAGAAFRITALYMEGDLMKAEAVILDTAGGKHLKGLLDGGVGVAISTRGYGSFKLEKRKVSTPNGEVEIEVEVIQDDFRLEGIDAVLFPSNPSGAVTRHEQETPKHKENKNMDLTTLRQEHPELVAQIESAAREGYVAEADVEARIAESLESDDVTAPRAVIAAIVEALRPLVPALAEAEQTEAERELAEVSTKIEALEAQLREAQARADEAERAAQEEAARAARTALVDELLEGFEEADLIRASLATLEDEAAIRAAFDTQKALIEAVRTRKKVNQANAGTEEDQGAGTADRKDEGVEDETPQAVKEQIAFERSLISDLT